ncbi:MAG: tRNA (guanosine(37)-N1)-methyltransferase TrmD [Spirochaetaceae bacterium]|jgi:tRNA (guanine37-N1)-methyltransferase|nr:tRNA (guanosine(37)-N1)-methyltransferase TrmD [Spirochaetaceae bacterium]
MKYTVLSLFPEIIDTFFTASIMAKAISRGIVSYRSINIRDYAFDKHKTCDDAPYGGGAGMLMMPEPLSQALAAAGAKEADKRVIYLSPSGRLLTQDLAKDLSREQELILICGRYEGIDQRVIDIYVDDEVSIGDYVLSSGETAALALIDATYRLLDGVISHESLDEESFSGGLLEYPQYTRPEIYDNIQGQMRVPEILLSGHHENIRRWRLKKRVEKTFANRPDLLRNGIKKGLFDEETRKIIDELSGITEEL